MNSVQQRKLTRQEPNRNPNARPLCNARPGSLLAYRDNKVLLMERDIGVIVGTY
jgi:hypothetical protein